MTLLLGIIAGHLIGPIFLNGTLTRESHPQFLIYKASVNDVEELRYRIQGCCRRIQITPGTFERVRRFIMRHLEIYIQTEGDHFEVSMKIIK
ncbi:transposase-like protein [Vespula squamosa]|uniref:Transposase-like protein n=1 Tax=Vespula squamosa TaxID=30214 RepID=A0ABD2BSI9_VESSQ